MTVEDRRGNMDQFPVGLRVLAVDDEPTCLKVLETLLRRCQYNVTVTNQAITALKLLRENKDNFDLVISDVHMPDMDGFKLLELVGLEMDLPVIMLSANGETEMVMKGITHGACDYLLKPVRIEELKNIWQHVIRRKRYDKRCHNQKKTLNNTEGGEDDQKTPVTTIEGADDSTDKSEKLSKKRKDQSEEYEDDSEDNLQENEDGTSQKKPRVVWTVELHQKFVSAVNQLGVDKAVPKKILDLMNVESITRENVASHLQKYRLYLKRISTVAGQQGSLAAALAGRNSYVHMASFNGYRNYNTFGGSRQLPNIAAYQPNLYLGRINASASVGMNGLLPSQTVQLGGTHKSGSYTFDGLGKPQDISALGNNKVTSIQGVPVKLELDALEQPKVVHEMKNQSSAGFSGSGLTSGVHANSFPAFGKNSTLLQPNQQYNQAGVSGYHSSIRVSSTGSNPFQINFQDSSPAAHLARCDNTWQGAVPSEQTTNALPILASFTHSGFSPGTNMQNASSFSLHTENHVSGETSNGKAGNLRHDSDINSVVRSHMHLLGGSMMVLPSGVGEESDISRIVGNSGSKCDGSFTSNALTTTSSSSSFPSFELSDTIALQQASDYGLSNISTHGDAIGQAALAAPALLSNPLVGNSIMNSQHSFKDEYPLETAWWQDGLSNGASFDDLLNSVIKPV